MAGWVQSIGLTRRNNPSRVVLIQKDLICWRRMVLSNTPSTIMTCAAPFPEVLINADDIP